MRIISEEWVQALLRYLVVRPYSEVYQIIPILQNLPEFIEPPKAPEQDK